MVPLFQIFGPSLVPLLSKTGPLFGPSEGLFEGGTRLVITALVQFIFAWRYGLIRFCHHFGQKGSPNFCNFGQI